jgi:hypothetical protein
MIEINCIRDCDAACCKKREDRRVVFDFSDKEVLMFEQNGVTLIRVTGGGYSMPEECIFLEGIFCTLHGQDEQPACCVDNKAGEDLCLWMRQPSIDRRWNEVE